MASSGCGACRKSSASQGWETAEPNIRKTQLPTKKSTEAIINTICHSERLS